jgi:triosephosphate isomerase
MRRRVIAGNWKMNKTVPQAVELAHDMRGELSSLSKVDIIICPPFVALGAVRDAVRQTDIAVGAQNMHWEAEGTFTGEVAPGMVQGLCTHVIVGHSERRGHFGETDDIVNRKTIAAVAYGLTAIVCVGETDEENRAGKTQEVLDRQTTQALAGLSAQQAAAAILAYEPVWAIGTGRAAAPEQANATIGLVREVVRREFDAATADAIRILYGGSINPDVWPEIIAQPEVDGGLVGGASLKAADFVALASQTQAAG